MNRVFWSSSAYDEMRVTKDGKSNGSERMIEIYVWKEVEKKRGLRLNVK